MFAICSERFPAARSEGRKMAVSVQTQSLVGYSGIMLVTSSRDTELLPAGESCA